MFLRNWFRVSIALTFFFSPVLYSQNDPGGGVGVTPRWQISDGDDEQLKVMKKFHLLLEDRLGSAIDAANSLLEEALERSEARGQLLRGGIDAMQLVAAAARDLRYEERGIRRSIARSDKILAGERSAAESKFEVRQRGIATLEASISREESEASPIKAEFLNSISQGVPDLDLEFDLYHRYRKVSDLKKKRNLQSSFSAEDHLDVQQFQLLLAANIQISRHVDVAFDRLRDLEDAVAITTRRFHRHLRSRSHGRHVSVTSAAIAVANALDVEGFTAFLQDADSILGSRGAKIGEIPGPLTLDDASAGIDSSGFRSWIETSESTLDVAETEGEIQ